MRIQSINNTNFTGLFTDRSKQSGGDWKMEYEPYSWEKSGVNKFGMSSQKEWDIMSDSLPDNEKRYRTINLNKYTLYKESSADILGTEFYYCNFDNGIMRNQIDEIHAMNREDSLKVQSKKLERFIELKKEALNDIENNLASEHQSMQKSSKNFNIYAKDFDNGFFERVFSKQKSKDYMVENNKNIVASADNMYQNMKNYIKICNSIDNVKETIAKNKKEINLLSTARQVGKLIDISKRTVYDPNEPLWHAMQNVKEATHKLISLPHMTISVNEILQKAGIKLSDKDVSAKAIEYVDKLIASIRFIR